MQFTTPPPPIDILQVEPRLREFAKTAIRLHPRRGDVPDPAASKIGGLFLWPESEPWPSVPNPGEPDWYEGAGWPLEDAEVPLMPLVQLRADEFPEVEFPAGKNLLQLFWCPVHHSAPIFVAKPYLFWRSCAEVAVPRSQPPSLPEWNSMNMFAVQPCQISPERVPEYISSSELSGLSREGDPVGKEIWRTILDWKGEYRVTDNGQPVDDNTLSGCSYYQQLLSTCLGTKVQGYADWIQFSHWPIVCQCGARMEHLLSISTGEWNCINFPRWRPLQSFETGVKPISDDLPGGCLYVFICRHCPDWPIKSVYER